MKLCLCMFISIDDNLTLISFVFSITKLGYSISYSCGNKGAWNLITAEKSFDISSTNYNYLIYNYILSSDNSTI